MNNSRFSIRSFFFGIVVTLILGLFVRFVVKVNTFDLETTVESLAGSEIEFEIRDTRSHGMVEVSIYNPEGDGAETVHIYADQLAEWLYKTATAMYSLDDDKFYW